MVKPVRYTSEALSWEVLPRAAYLPDLAPSNYHLFASMGHAHAEQCFGWYEDVKNDSMNGSQQKGRFYWHSIHKLPERWGKCITNDGAYFKKPFLLFSEFNMFFSKKSAFHTFIPGK